METVEAYGDDPSWHYSDEENLADLRGRALRALTFLKEHPEETILVVTHGRFLRVLLAVILLGENVSFAQFTHLAKSVKTYNGGITFCTNEVGHWKLCAWNDHAHLA